MKTFIKIFMLIALASLTLTACGKDKDGGSGSNPGDGGYYGGGYNKDTVILEGGVTKSNNSAYRALVNGLFGCDNSYNDILGLNSCSYLDDAAPRIQVILDDYLFRGQNGSTTGSVTISSQQFQGIPTRVGWRKIDSNTAFDTQVLLPSEIDGQLMRVKLIGLSTDSQIPVELYYGDVLIGTGYLNRMNR